MLLIAVLLISQGMLRMAVSPLWAHYDETSHFEYILYIKSNQKLPEAGSASDLSPIIETFGDVDVEVGCWIRNVTAEYCIWHPGHQFDEAPGYYLLQAVILSIIPTNTVPLQVRIAQFVSILMSVGVGLMSYYIIRLTFPDSRLFALAVPTMLSVTMGYVDLMSAVSNDVAAVFAYTMMLFSLTLIIYRGVKIQTLLLVLMSGLFCLLAKSSSWIGIALIPVVVLLRLLPGISRKHRIIILVAIGLVFLGSTIALFVGLSDSTLLLQASSRLRAHLNPANWWHYAAAMLWQIISYWSAFGNGLLGIPTRVLLLIPLTTMLMSAAGLIKGLTRLSHYRKVLTRNQWQVLLVSAVAVIFALAVSFLRIDSPGGYVPTARHFYISIVPTNLFLILGLGLLIPVKYHRRFLAALILILFALHIWSILNVQLPYFIETWPIPY